MADLFALADLAAFLQVDLDTATAAQARTMATGVVLGYTRLAAVPDEPVFAAIAGPVAMRVAGRLYENPSDLRAETLSGYSTTYSPLLDDSDRLVLSYAASVAGGVGRAMSVQLDF